MRPQRRSTVTSRLRRWPISACWWSLPRWWTARPRSLVSPFDRDPGCSAAPPRVALCYADAIVAGRRGDRRGASRLSWPARVAHPVRSGGDASCACSPGAAIADGGVSRSTCAPGRPHGPSSRAATPAGPSLPRPAAARRCPPRRGRGPRRAAALRRRSHQPGARCPHPGRCRLSNAAISERLVPVPSYRRDPFRQPVAEVRVANRQELRSCCAP